MNTAAIDPATMAAPLRRSIAGRLLFSFLVIALIPWAIMTVITFRIAATSLEISVRDNLTRIAAAKTGEIEAYALERVRDGLALAAAPSVVAAVRGGGGDPAEAGGFRIATETAEFLRRSADALGYAQVLVIGADGRVLHALDESHRRWGRGGGPRRNWRPDSTGRGSSSTPTSPVSRATAGRPNRSPSSRPRSSTTVGSRACWPWASHHSDCGGWCPIWRGSAAPARSSPARWSVTTCS
jgi:hypothetical protein